jgi:hypothetical protein
MRRPRVISILTLAVVLLAAPSARGGSADLVISQVFARGGNAGAPYANDYVEVFNRGSTSIDLTGWSVQYATGAGTTWSATPLAGSLSAGRRYLVQFASGGTVGVALPAPDAVDTTSLAATGGKVALVHGAAALTCGASPGSCSAVTTVHDLVGYGTASDYESAAAPALSNTTALTRAGAGCVDSDSNAADFTTEAPAPRNSIAAASACAGGSGAATFTQSTGIAVDIQSSISLSLERATVSFGPAAPGDRPAAVSQRVTVLSTDTAGYALTVRRTQFAPADLPLGVAASAVAGGQLSAPFAGGALVALPSTSDLLLGTSAARSATGGDVWPTSLAFTSPLPAVAPGRYTATVVYTVIGGTIG